MHSIIIAPRFPPNQRTIPLGLAYISSFLKKAGKDVDCLDLNHFVEPTEKTLRRYLHNKRYDVICTGGLSIYYHEIKEIVEHVRKIVPHAKIVMGGALVSSEPELMYDALKPDYMVVGEGEETLLELLEHLENNKTVNSIKGLVFRDSKGNIVFTGPRPRISDLDALPLPDYEAFGYSSYLDNMHPSDVEYYDIYDHPRVHGVIGSRDCPFKCTFCYHVLGGQYVQRSIDSIMNELEQVVRHYRINIITFYDQLFANEPKRVLELCSRIKPFLKSLPWECRWFVAGLRAPNISDALIKTMIDAGCFMTSFGLESYNLKVLKSFKKQITPQQIDRAVQIAFNNRISLWANFIFFDVAETVSSAQETLNYWKKNSKIGLELTHIRPFPGTAIYNHCVEKGTIRDKLRFIADRSQECFNTSDLLTEEEFRDVQHDIAEAWALYRKYAVPKSMHRTGDGTISFSIRCPHCRKTTKYSNYLYTWPGMKIYCRQCRKTFFTIPTVQRHLAILLLRILSKISPKAIWKRWDRRIQEHLRQVFNYDDDKIEKLSHE